MAWLPQTRRRLVAATWWLAAALALLLLGVGLGRPLYYSDGGQLVAADALQHAAMRHWLPPEPSAELPGPVRGRIARAPDGRLVYGQARGEQRTDLVAFDPRQPHLPPEPLLLVNSSGHDLAPAFGSDGSLYFASDRPGGAGGYDLYRAPRRGDSWAAPEPLVALNSPLDDIDPAVHGDELVLVRSDRRLLGGYHAQLLRRAADGTAQPLWQGPRGQDANAQDREPAFAADGSELWFVRRQSGRALSLQVATRLGSDYAAPQPAPSALQLRTARSPLPGADGLRLGLLQVGEDGASALYYESAARLLAPYWPGQEGLFWSLAGLLLVLVLLALLLQWGARWATLDLLALCLLASLLLHLLVMAWLMGVELAEAAFGRRSRGDDTPFATVVFASTATAGEADGNGDGSLPQQPRAAAVAPALLLADTAAAMVVAAPAAALPPLQLPPSAAAALASTLADTPLAATVEIPVTAPQLAALPAPPPVPPATAAAGTAAPTAAVWQEALATLATPSLPAGMPHAAAQTQAVPELATIEVAAPTASLPAPSATGPAAVPGPAALPTSEPGLAAAALPAAPRLAALPELASAAVPAAAPADQPALAPHLPDMAAMPLPSAPTTQPVASPRSEPEPTAAAQPFANLAAPAASLPLPTATAQAVPQPLASLSPLASTTASAPLAPQLRALPGPPASPTPPAGMPTPNPPALAMAAPPAAGLGTPSAPSHALPTPSSLWRGSLPWPEWPPPKPPAASLPAPPPLQDVAAAAPAIAVADAYSNRFGPQKAAALRQFGGSQATERAVAQGLRYLASRQRPAGCFGDPTLWDAKYGSTAIGKTGLCLLAFLGAGHTGAPDDEHGAVVRRAVDWLLAQQDASGAVGTGSCYGHGIATYALAECYGLTRDERLELPLQAALQWIVRHQGPRRDRKNRGGWGYFGPATPVEDDFARVSVSAWMVMALRAAELSGFGLPPKVLSSAREYFEESFDSQNGWFRYTQKPSRLSSSWPTLPASTPAGAFCLLLLGADPEDGKVTAALEYTLRRAPQAYRRYPDDDFVRRAQGNVYFWYYATLASFVAGGDTWQAWNGHLQRVLLPAQAADGSFAPIDTYARLAGDDAGDACYTTALCVLSLEVYYRYFTPLLQAR
jgi:hypothetical protein